MEHFHPRFIPFRLLALMSLTAFIKFVLSPKLSESIAPRLFVKIEIRGITGHSGALVHCRQSASHLNEEYGFD
jgi:hypothetical protein